MPPPMAKMFVGISLISIELVELLPFNVMGMFGPKYILTILEKAMCFSIPMARSISLLSAIWLKFWLEVAPEIRYSIWLAPNEALKPTCLLPNKRTIAV